MATRRGTFDNASKLRNSKRRNRSIHLSRRNQTESTPNMADPKQGIIIFEWRAKRILESIGKGIGLENYKFQVHIINAGDKIFGY